MIKKLALTFFLAAFALIAQANAQNAISTEKQTAIAELVALINVDNKAEDLVRIMSMQMDSIREETIKSVLDERADLTAAEKKSLRDTFVGDSKEYSKRFQEKLMQKLNYGEMINEIAAIVYDKYYTLDEIKDLTAFYRTATGQKTLKTMTPLFTDTMKLTQERLLPKIPTILKELQDEEKADIERRVNIKKPKKGTSK